MHTACFRCSTGGSACTIGTERVVLCDSLLYLQMIVQCTSYVCKPGCFSGLVHKGRQLCSLLLTSYQSSGLCNHKHQSELCLRQFQLIHRIPRTADVPCRLGYVFALSFFLSETL